MDPHNTTRCWTIQPLSVWEALDRDGVVQVDVNHSKYSGERVWQYDWLSSQLRRRLKGYNAEYPWWCYCEKPALRDHCTGSLPGGRAQVRLELKLDANRCARFPIWMWNMVFSGRFLATSRREYLKWEQDVQLAVPDEDEWPLPQPWRTHLERSWERLFKTSLHGDCWLPAAGDEDVWFTHSGQITFEIVTGELRREQVREVTHFQTEENVKEPFADGLGPSAIAPAP